MCELGCAHNFIRAHVIGLAIRAACEDAQQPYHQIRGMEVGPQRGAIPADFDGTATPGIAQEIAGREMGIERQMRAKKGKGACGHEIDVRLGAETLGGALGRAVGHERFCGGGILFPRALGFSGELAVDCSGTHVKQARAIPPREIEHALRAIDDRARAFKFALFAGGHCVGGGMDHHVGTDLPAKVGHVARLKMEFTPEQFRPLAKERRRVAREHGGVQAQGHLRVRAMQRRQQPLAEKAGAAGDEKTLAAQRLEIGRAETKNVVEIVRGQAEQIVLRFVRHLSNTPEVIAPHHDDRINSQSQRLVLLRNNLLVSALILALLECWRPCFFLTDDNLDGAFPRLVEMGHELLGGRNVFVSEHLFGGNYNALRDPAFLTWHPFYFLATLLAGTPLHNGIIDVICIFLFLLASAGFVNLAWYLRREMPLEISDGWIMFYTQSFTFSMAALTMGASWFNFIADYAALPWLVLGLVQKSWRAGLGLVVLFTLHMLLGGHLLPTMSNSIFLSIFAMALGLARRSWQPAAVWFAGYAITIVVTLPLLWPAIDGFSHSVRAGGVPLDDMEANNVPLSDFPTSIFLGMALWLINPHPHPYTTYTIALGSSAATWCLLPAMVSRGKWRPLEVVTVGMLLFAALLIIRPHWVSKIMLHLPLFRSMRWPFREFVQFQFFLHLFLLVRPPGLEPVMRRVAAIIGTVVLVVPMLLFPLPPTFNAMTWDRELVLDGGLEQYWSKVRPLLKPGDRIAVLIPLDLYTDDRFEVPYSLLNTFDYAVLSDTIGASGYSPAAPLDQLYLHTYTVYPFGAWLPDQKAALMAERPDLKFITLEGHHPLRITLSSRDGPTIDLTPFVPPRHSKIPDQPVPK